jgi:hypothetical protein
MVRKYSNSWLHINFGILNGLFHASIGNRTCLPMPVSISTPLDGLPEQTLTMKDLTADNADWYMFNIKIGANIYTCLGDTDVVMFFLRPTPSQQRTWLKNQRFLFHDILPPAVQRLRRLAEPSRILLVRH